MSDIWNFIKGLGALAAMATLFAILMFFEGLKDMRDDIEDPLELHSSITSGAAIQIERRYGGKGNSVRFDVELLLGETIIPALLDPPSGSVFEIYAEREIYRFTTCILDVSYAGYQYKYRITATIIERDESDTYESEFERPFYESKYGDPTNNIEERRFDEDPDTYVLRPIIWGEMSPSGNISPRAIRAAERINQQRDLEKSLINDEEMMEDHVVQEDIKHIGARIWTFLVIGIFVLGISIKISMSIEDSAPKASEGLAAVCAIVAFPLMYYALGETDLTWIGKGIWSLVAAFIAAFVGPGFLGACVIVFGLYYGWMILAWLLF